MLLVECEARCLTQIVPTSSDYHSIDPCYGTLEDWDKLLAGVHERGMRLLYVNLFS